jgi:hypothetical protein
MKALILAILAAAAVTGVAAPAGAQPGSASDPIIIRMRPGTDRVRITGDLRQNHDCCAYRFEARAGQTLYWTLTGPAVRVVMTYPDGRVDGPGVPGVVPLPQSGVYVFAVSPDLMADGAFGRFVLRMRIPPR